MKFDMDKTVEKFETGTKEFAENAHTKTNEFHENYVSKYTPDCGKYGKAATFAAEMIPGVSEYNAIREGDWTAFAIAAGIDVAALAIGAVTLGTGFAATKGATTAAKTGAKVAAREVAEAGTKKVVKELAEEGAEKLVKEAAEAGTKKVVKEVAEASAEKAVKEIAEAGVEKAAKEVAEAGVEKAAKEVAEAGVEKAAKEVAEAGVEKATKEVAEAGVEKATKEVAEAGAEKATKEVAEAGAEKVVKETSEDIEKKAVQIVKNKLDGCERERKVLKELISEFGDNNVISEALIRDKNGIPIKDIVTKEARRIDFVVKEGEKIVKSIEVTSETAIKEAQMAKELRILETAKELGGAFIKDPNTGELLEFATNIATEIRRL